MDVLRRRALLARVALGDLGGVVVGRVQLSLKLGASLSRRGQLRRQLINGACTPVRALRLPKAHNATRANVKLAGAH